MGSNQNSGSIVIENYLTICADDVSSVSYNPNDSSGDIYYSLNGKKWEQYVYNIDNPPTINMIAGDYVCIKGNKIPLEDTGIGNLNIDGSVHLEGNCMSLLFMDDASNQFDLTGYDYAFEGLFSNCVSITSVSANLLPATTLSTGCYCEMFYSCTKLTNTPNLPGNTTPHCYTSMFHDCSSLVSAPTLTSPEVQYASYQSMFQGCKKLVNPPGMLNTTIQEMGCQQMFYGCSLLDHTPYLKATTLYANAYDSMFYGCTNLTSAEDIKAYNLTGSHIFYRMFYNCKKLDTTPIFYKSGSVLEYEMYQMFYGCSAIKTNLVSLGDITSIGTYGCYGMFRDCTSLTSVGAISATTIGANGCYGMFRGCTSLKSLTTFAPTKLTSSSLRQMFYGCTKLTDVPSKIVATTGSKNMCQQMFYGCTALQKPPIINSTLMATAYDYAFDAMFYNCSSLSTSPFSGKFTAKGSNYTFRDMFYGCRSLLDTGRITLSMDSKGTSACQGMFYGCTKLIAGPSIASNTKTFTNEFYQMFYNCTALNKCSFDLSASTLASDCCNYMFAGCTSLVEAPTITSAAFDSYLHGTSMFRGCTKLHHLTLLTSIIQDVFDTGESFLSGNNIGTFIKNPSLKEYDLWAVLPDGWTPIDVAYGASATYTKTIYQYYNGFDYARIVIVFDKSMTWQQWVNSKYNIYNAVVDGDKIRIKYLESGKEYHIFKYNDDTYVSPSQVISYDSGIKYMIGTNTEPV